MNGRLTITDVAKIVGVTPRTIMRWEKSGKVKKPKRDWRGWRFYIKEDVAEIKQFFETSYEYNEEEGTMVSITKGLIAIFIAATLTVTCFASLSYAETSFTPVEGMTETSNAIEVTLDQLPVMGTASASFTEDVKYTLGHNDVIEIEVRRHPEFSGQYAITSEGKIEYKFVGDIIVEGLTKAELTEQLETILSEYIIEPEINVRIVAYLSKVFYVVGDVGKPGKFYMRGNTVTIREALVQSGLPTGAASMRKCRLITPDQAGEDNYVKVDIYKLLYEGDLRENLDMQPGEVLYVPATALAKMLRVFSPVTNAVGQAAGVASTATGF
ncbi:polysaccharide biosynthesis/export family protein [Candidatus Omnitrophota bacterium]